MITPNKMTVLNDRTEEFLYVYDKLNDTPVASDNQARATAAIGIITLSQGKTAEFVAPPASTPEFKKATEIKTDGPKCSVCGRPTIPKKSERTGKEYTYCTKCRENRTVEGKPFEVKQ